MIHACTIWGSSRSQADRPFNKVENSGSRIWSKWNPTELNRKYYSMNSNIGCMIFPGRGALNTSLRIDARMKTSETMQKKERQARVAIGVWTCIFRGGRCRLLYQHPVHENWFGRPHLVTVSQYFYLVEMRRWTLVLKAAPCSYALSQSMASISTKIVPSLSPDAEQPVHGGFCALKGFIVLHETIFNRKVSF